MSLVRNKIDFNQSPINLKFLIAEYLQNIIHYAENRSIEIVIDVSMLSDHVVIDKDSVVSILSQLIDNAILSFESYNQLNENKIINVCFTHSNEKEGQSYLNIAVVDNGVGIPRNRQEKVFCPYISDVNNIGLGLGLSIVKERVNRLKGKLSMKSEVNEGTEIFICLPCNYL